MGWKWSSAEASLQKPKASWKIRRLSCQPAEDRPVFHVVVGVVKCNTTWHEVGVGGFYSYCPNKRKTCWESVTPRLLGSASCAYWADMQLYRTTGSVQQEQESSPLPGQAEHTGPLSTGGSTAGAASNLRKCLRLKRRFLAVACTPIRYGLSNPAQKLCNVPAYIYLCVPGCWLQTEMTGIWHQMVYRCPATPSPSTAVEGTLHSHPAEDHALLI